MWKFLQCFGATGQHVQHQAPSPLKRGVSSDPLANDWLGNTSNRSHSPRLSEQSEQSERHVPDCAVHLSRQHASETLEHLVTLLQIKSAASASQTDIWSTLQGVANSVAAILPTCSISVNIPTSSRQLVKVITPLRPIDDELRPINEVPSMLDALQASKPAIVVAASEPGKAASCSYMHMPLTFASVTQGTLLITSRCSALPLDHRCLLVASLLPLLTVYLYESGAVRLCDMLEKLQTSSSVNALALNMTQELHKCFDWCHPEETEVRLVLMNPDQAAALVLARSTPAAEPTEPMSLMSSSSSHWNHMSCGSNTQEPGDAELQGIQVPQVNTLTHQCMLDGSKMRLVDVLSAMKASGQAWSDVFLGSALVMNPAWVMVAPVKVSDKQCGAILWLSSTRLNPELLLKAANATVPCIAHAVSQCLQRVGVAPSPNIATHLWSHALTRTVSRLGLSASRPGSGHSQTSPQTPQCFSFNIPAEPASIRCKVTVSDSASTLALMQTYQATITQQQRSAMSRTASGGGKGGEDEIIEVISKAGQGTFGSVYVALWKGLTVAVKVLRSQADGRKAMRMAWELAVSNSLHHPNVVRVHAVLTDVTVEKAGHNIIRFSPSGRSRQPQDTMSSAPCMSAAAPEEPDTSKCHVLILEYCNRGSLNTFLADKYFLREAAHASWKSMSGSLGLAQPSSWQRDSHMAPPMRGNLRRARSMTLLPSPLRPILPLLIDVASAMLYLHSRGFIHCDLKPENLLVKAAAGNGSGLVIKVADFGLTDMQTGEGMVMGELGGTITHVAPEVVFHKKVTKACDVYSFGIIMFELFTCQRPYEDILRSKLPQAEQDKAIVCRLMKEELRPQFPSSAPSAYVQLAHRCWAMDPTVRPTFAEVLCELKAMLSPQELKEVASAPSPHSCTRAQPAPGTSRLSNHAVAVGWKVPADEAGIGRPRDVSGGAGMRCHVGPARVPPPRRACSMQCETSTGTRAGRTGREEQP